jgi:hypothetical protein
MRHDAHLWIRPDAARFLPRGMDPAEVYPALARKQDAVKAAAAAAFAAEIEQERRLLDVMRAEFDSIRAELARRRALERKYSPNQPRVPAGNRDGGQWTDGGGAGSSQGTGLALPMGDVDIGDVSGTGDVGDLFQIGPDETRVDGVQLAGDDRSLEINPDELSTGIFLTSI